MTQVQLGQDLISLGVRQWERESRELMAKTHWRRDVEAHAEDARVAQASAAAADERFQGLDARHRLLEKSADAAVREADGRAADLRTAVEQCRRELAAVRGQLTETMMGVRASRRGLAMMLS